MRPPGAVAVAGGRAAGAPPSLRVLRFEGLVALLMLTASAGCGSRTAVPLGPLAVPDGGEAAVPPQDAGVQRDAGRDASIAPDAGGDAGPTVGCRHDPDCSALGEPCIADQAPPPRDSVAPAPRLRHGRPRCRAR